MPNQTSFLNHIRHWVVKIEGDSFTFVRIVSMATSASPKARRGFDYTSLDGVTSQFVQQQTGEIRALMKRTAQDIIEVGKRLIRIKKRLGHGRFLNWLEAEFDWHRDTANKFMHVANQFGSLEMSNISTFDLSALYQLAAPSTPKAARNEALARAASGEPITYKAAKAIKQKYATPLSSKPKVEPTSQQEPQSLPTPPIPAPIPQSGSKLEIVAFRPQIQAPPISETARAIANQTGVTLSALRADQTSSNPDVPGVWWQLEGKHLLYCGNPNSPEFLKRIPEKLSLLLAFPPIPGWLPTILAKTYIISTEYLPQGKKIEQLNENLESNVLFHSKLGEMVVSCFLPSPEILSIINRHSRRGLFAEPDSKRVAAVVSDWKGAGLKVERLNQGEFSYT